MGDSSLLKKKISLIVYPAPVAAGIIDDTIIGSPTNIRAYSSIDERCITCIV